MLSSYGEEFFSSLEKLVYDHQVKRDREADHIDDIREEQARLDQELREILEEQESRLQDLSLKAITRDDSFVQETDYSVFKDKVNVKKQKDLEVATSKTETNNFDRYKIKQTESEDRRDLNSPVLDTSRKSDYNSGRKTKRDSVRQKRPEWNNDFTGEFSNLSIDDPESATEIGSSEAFTQDSVSGQNLFSDLKHQDLLDSKLDSNTELKNELTDGKSGNENNSKPPKSKKKTGYTPNTFVPNRTLQLRRSGSLNKLTDSKPDYKTDKLSDQSATGNSKTDEQTREGREGKMSSGEQEHVRSLSRDRTGAKLPPKKPAFR